MSGPRGARRPARPDAEGGSQLSQPSQRGRFRRGKDAFLPRLKVPASALRTKPPPCGPCFSRAAKAAEASEALLESLYARLRARDWHFGEIRFRFLRRAQLSQSRGCASKSVPILTARKVPAFALRIKPSPCGPYFSRAAKAPKASKAISESLYARLRA